MLGIQEGFTLHLLTSRAMAEVPAMYACILALSLYLCQTAPTPGSGIICNSKSTGSELFLLSQPGYTPTSRALQFMQKVNCSSKPEGLAHYIFL